MLNVRRRIAVYICRTATIVMMLAIMRALLNYR